MFSCFVHRAFSSLCSAAIRPQGSIAITLDLYGQLYPDEMDRWADQLGEIAQQMWPERGQSDDKDDDRPPPAASAVRWPSSRRAE